MTLVLARHVGEEIVIDEEGKPPVIVSLEWARNGKARLGVVAEDGVRIFRRELYEKIYGPLEAAQTKTVPRGGGDGQRMRRRKRARSA